jgi:hypothetical protein
MNRMSRLLRERFSNATVNVYKKGITDSYTLESEIIEVCVLDGDIQPYSGKLAREEYGIEVERCMKVYCEQNPNITEGLYCVVNGGSDEYVIRYAEIWESGMMLVIERWTGK